MSASAAGDHLKESVEVVQVSFSYSSSLRRWTYKSIQLTSQHELIGVVRDGENVGRGLLALFASVGGHHLRVVNWQPLVGVHSDTEEARVGLCKGIRKNNCSKSLSIICTIHLLMNYNLKVHVK